MFRRVFPVVAFGARAMVSRGSPIVRNFFSLHERALRPLAAAAQTFALPRENTPNENSLKFFPTGRIILESGALEFPSARDQNTQKSPLAKELFQVEGVQSVFFSHDYVTITKSPEIDWSVVKPHVFAAIMDFFDSNQPVYTDEMPVTDTTILPEDDDVVAAIKELLEMRIRPVVLRDGGNIVYRGFKDGYVHLQMTGACSTCSSSKATLNVNVENMLMHYIPEVKGVKQVDDEGADLSQKEFDAVEARLKSYKHVHVPQEDK